MIGLLALGHLVLVVISLVVCTLSLLSIIRKRRNAKNITAFSIAALAFIVLTWGQLVGFGLYKVQCALFSGLQINKPAHAINEGYLLKDSKNWGSGQGYNGYVSKAIEDLTTGRIGYFEVYDSHSDQLKKYFLADKRSFKCRSFGGGAAYIPESKCLASEPRYSPSSKYIVEGYDKSGTGNDPSVTNASNGAVISKLRTFSHRISIYNSKRLSCPSSAEYPRRRITAFTFEDSFGFTWPLDSNINYPKDFFNKGGTYAIGKKSSDYGVSKNPNKLCSDFRTEIDFHNVNYSFHKISVTKGKNRHEAIVDRNSITSYVDIFVNKADKPVLLYLSGYDPIVWKIHLEKGADLLGVFADGYHGKAVVGPKKSTPIFIHTKEYNPAINCSSIDFYAPFRREFDTTTAVRVGEQFVINGSYKGAKEYKFYTDYPLEKYELLYRHDK